MITRVITVSVTERDIERGSIRLVNPIKVALRRLSRKTSNKLYIIVNENTGDVIYGQTVFKGPRRVRRFTKKFWRNTINPKVNPQVKPATFVLREAV